MHFKGLSLNKNQVTGEARGNTGSLGAGGWGMGYLSFPGPGTPEQRSHRPRPAAPSLAAQTHCWGNSSPRFLRQSCRKEMLVPRGRPWAWAWPEIQSPVPFRLGRARQPVSIKTPPQSSGSPQIQREPEGPGLGTPEPWVLWASFPHRGLGVGSALRRAWGPRPTPHCCTCPHPVPLDTLFSPFSAAVFIHNLAPPKPAVISSRTPTAILALGELPAGT